MPKARRVQLTQEEIDLVYRSAEERAKAGKVIKSEGAKRGTYQDIEIEQIGIAAEIAVCKYYDVEPDLSITSVRKDAGADITLNGQTANIKATKYFYQNDPYLLVKPSDLKYDAYILCTVELDEGLVDIKGWYSKDQLAEVPPENFKGGNRKVRAVRSSALNQIKKVKVPV